MRRGLIYIHMLLRNFVRRIINFFKSKGTQASPAAVQSTGYELDSLGGINFGGWDGVEYFTGSASILTSPDENWTSSNHGGHLSIYGTNIGGASPQAIAQFGGLDSTQTGTTNNIIFFRPLVWGNNGGAEPGIFPVGASSPLLEIRTANNSADAGLTVGTLTASGKVGAGTSTPIANFQVANGSNATTTMEIGSSGQNKGSCLKLYRTDGSAIYAYVAAGATTFTLTTTACANVSNF
jgi:hypothetical protein